MRDVGVKYLKQDTRNGNFLYRRRVPKALADMVGKTEFVRALGTTEQEAIACYGAVHRRIEHVVALGKGGVNGLSPTEQRQRLIAILQDWGADPYSPGRDENEQTWREVAAERLVDRYQDPDTGEYVGVPEGDGAIAAALLGGVPKETPEPTITDAFRFYLKENASGTPENCKKREQRFRRAERHLIAAAGSDKALSKVTREDARRWRDTRTAAGVKPATIHREKNDLSAVINTARSELDATGENPFSKLKLPKSETSRQDQRQPLPIETITGVYDALAKGRADLLAIWTLLDHTGARPSEVSQLQVGEIVLDYPVPHIVIQEREGRSLKTSWSNRNVPLVGAALEAAKGAVKGVTDPEAPAFPRFHGEGGMDRLSHALNRPIRLTSPDKRHTCYSLRHNMKDRLRVAEVFPDTQKAILGHAFGNGEDAAYGHSGSIPLEQKRDALLRALGLAGVEP